MRHEDLGILVEFKVVEDLLVMQAGSDRPISVRLLHVSKVFEMVNASDSILQSAVSLGRLLSLTWFSLNSDRGQYY